MPTLNTDSSEIDAGSTARLSWDASGYDSCTASGGWSGDKPVTGSETVGPIDQATTFTLTCNEGSQSSMQMLAVRVFSDIEICWDAPSGSSAVPSQVSGYRIYVGDDSQDYGKTIEIDDPSASQTTLKLLSGTQYLAISALANTGDESELSNEIAYVAP